MSSPVRLARIDYAVATLVLVDADAPADESLPTPGHAPARKTDDGYLIVDALIARDGVLKYSDGADEWLEYRPRAELERAANGWIGLPFTDKHPTRMVDAKTWSKVAKGTHIAVLGVVDIDGVAYIHARLMITDAAVVADIEKQSAKGEPVQLSIGFTSEVHDEAGLWMGQPYVAVQRNLIANHTAKVPAGRAGPACRVLFDGVDCAMYDQGAMLTNAKPPTAGKRDDAGSPNAMVQVPDPITGEMISVPSSIAQLMQEYAALKGGAPMPAPAPAAPPMAQPAAPMQPMANAAPPAPMPAPAGAPLEKPEDKREGKPEDAEDDKDKDDVKDKDRKESVQALVVARRKLERDAEACGIRGDALDGDDVSIKRAIVAAKIPGAKVDALDGVALDAYVDAALAVKAPAASRPWGQGEKQSARAGKDDSATRITIDSESARAVAESLAAQGY